METDRMYNQTIEAIEPSRSVTLMAQASAMQKTDPTVLNLTGGDPDFATPKAICDAMFQAVEQGYTHYTNGPGEPELRARIARKLREENGAAYEPEQVLITPGGKLAIYLAVRCLLNKEDEALWLAPGWVSYPSIVQASGGVPRCVHLRYENGYHLERELLEAAVSERTKLLIINYPNNPTGKILSEADIQVLSEFLLDHPQVYILSDEMYEKVIYDGAKNYSPASDPKLLNRTITVNGFSKCSAMTGWRIGYLAAPEDLMPVLTKLFSHTMSCTSGFLQKGALAALDLPEETERMRQAYEKRRGLLTERIREIPGIKMQVPGGAFYAWIRFEDYTDSEALAAELLEKERIAGVPGIAYGEEDVCCVRFSFASSEEKLTELCDRLASFMREARA